MNALRNKVQLIGHVGNDPEIKNFEGGRMLASFSLATTDSYKNDKGEKVGRNPMAQISGLGKTAELIDKYVNKGKEIAVEGKLTHRSYDGKDGDKRYITEVVINEVLLLGK